MPSRFGRSVRKVSTKEFEESPIADMDTQRAQHSAFSGEVKEMKIVLPFGLRSLHVASKRMLPAQK